jgi:hypothetical protein
MAQSNKALQKPPAQWRPRSKMPSEHSGLLHEVNENQPQIVDLVVLQPARRLGVTVK